MFSYSCLRSVWRTRPTTLLFNSSGMSSAVLVPIACIPRAGLDQIVIPAALLLAQGPMYILSRFTLTGVGHTARVRPDGIGEMVTEFELVHRCELGCGKRKSAPEKGRVL